MATTPDEILKDTLELPSHDRARLAAALLASLDGQEDQREVDEAWAREVERRADEILSGQAVGEPWEDVRDELLEQLERPE